ncbi:hypothetical protein SBDP1_480013 [Syntrophobacter sp. SbD1]|nr:hypothetical protein SBDP1_480013 [Syntrophobacter sp. SbD1]
MARPIKGTVFAAAEGSGVPDWRSHRPIFSQFSKPCVISLYTQRYPMLKYSVKSNPLI